VEAIKFRMEQGQFTRADLTKLLGSSAKVAEVLQRKRALSKGMIVRLHRTFAIPYDVLLGDIERQQTTRKRKTSARTKKVHVGFAGRMMSRSVGRSSRRSRCRDAGLP
jgi:plasmid maintenance system antidote protein VapI